MSKTIKNTNGFTKREIFILILLMQILLSTLAVVYYCYAELGIFADYFQIVDPSYLVVMLLIVCGTLGGLGLYWFKEMSIIEEQEKTYELQSTKLRQMMEANDLLSSQKHDFLNSLQVIWGLAVLNDKEKVVNYIQKLTDNLKCDKIEITGIKKDESPYLYTLLINKLHKCKGLSIDVDLELHDVEKLEFINPIDIVNIFGNLIDNAIYEVSKLSLDARKICIDIYEEDGYIHAEVFNKGPHINDEVIDKMFLKGFTTKGSDGSGIGLYNVKNIVEKYNGTISVSSEEEYGINFHIMFSDYGKNFVR